MLVEVLESSWLVGALWWSVDIWILVQDPRIMYQLFYVSFSIVGVAHDHLYFAVLLLDVVFRYKTLTNVLKAVLLKGRQLVMVLLLTMVFMFIFSVFSFLYYRHYYYSGGITNVFSASTNVSATGKGGFACDSVMNCYITSIMYGLGDGRGIKAAQVQPEYPEGSSLFWEWETLPRQEQTILEQFYDRQIFDLLFFIVIIVICYKALGI